MPPPPSPLSQFDIISRRSALVEIKKSFLKPLRCREDETNDEVVMTVYLKSRNICDIMRMGELED